MSLTMQKSEKEAAKILTSPLGRIIYKYAFLIIVVCACSSVANAANEISVAPVNPEFTAWQTKAGQVTTTGLQEYEGFTLGYTPSPLDRSHLLSQKSVSSMEMSEMSTEGVPTDYDLRTLGYVTPVRDQNNCGSCWAFATYGPLESWLLKSASETRDFSENHLKNYHGFDWTPCGGGNADMSTAYLTRWAGPINETDDPYYDSDDRPSPGGTCQKLVRDVLWFFSASDIKNAIMTYGAMYTLMRWNNSYYNSSQYTYYYNGADANSNHAVTIVGWDDNKAVTGASGNGAWLIKNSWGTGWGDNGYFWLSYYDAVGAEYAVTFCNTAPTLLYTTTYQYDPLGCTTALSYYSTVPTTTGWAANIFVPTSNRQLKAVGLYTVDDAMSYKIWVYDTFSGGRFSNPLAAVSGSIANSGYHTIPLANPINLTTGNNFAIIVKFTTSTGYTYPIPVEKDIAGYSSGATASAGQSYVSIDGGTFVDLTTLSGYSKTNVCIRGLGALPDTTLTVLPGTGGTSIPTPGTHQYSYGTVVDINATPNQYYHFVNWTGTAVSSSKVANPDSPNTTVLMDGSYIIRANFAAEQTALTTSTATGGTISTPGIGTYLYDYNSNANIIASANSNYHFTNWTGTAVTAGKVADPNSYSTTVQMDANYAVQAHFALNIESLTTSAAAGGTVTTPGIGTYQYSYGTNANIAASPQDANHYFFNWTGTAVTAGKVANPNLSSTTVLMDADYAVQANFAIYQKSLTISTTKGGTITTPSTGTYLYEVDSIANIAASPDVNCRFVNWTGTAVSAGKVSNPGSTTATVIMDGNYTVRANFAVTPAFPGAEGSGRWATGGRGGDVYEVTNLNNSGPGSIVDAVSQINRTIVFRVSGTIELGDVILEPNSNTTIAGQTAPGDGICIKGRIHIKNNVHDIVIRYIRARVDEGAANSSGDAIDIDYGNNIIIDHVTASYSRDEGISCQETSDYVTVQWCIISEALTYQFHSYGSLVRGEYGQEKTYHHNLYAHNNNRNPRPGNYTAIDSDPEGLHFDFRNNVVYNWKGNYGGYNEDATMVSRYNFIGNAYIRGTESTTGYGNKIFREKCKVGYGYFADNSYDGNVPSDPWDLVYFHSSMTESDIEDYIARSYLIPMEPVTTTSPAQAKIDVLADAGASFPKRDIIDTRIVNDVINKTGHSIATTDDQPEGGWPILNSTTAPTDSDHDGMPNTWETYYSLDANDANDRNDYNFNTDYTNLEVYLASLVGDDAVPRQKDWTARYNGTANSNDYATDMAIDSNGNVYVTGYAQNSGTDYDFVTIKYTPDGNTVWTNIYSCQPPTSTPDRAQAIAIDANSNVVVAGYTYMEASGYNGAVVEYNSAGIQLWSKLYNYSGTSDDKFFDVAADANGNIYVVGTANGDALIIKYAPDGNSLWVRNYDGTGNEYDELNSMIIDSNGDIYACGYSGGVGTYADGLVVKYSPNGDMLWVQTYDGSDHQTDWLEAITLDSSGNVYATGTVGTELDTDYVTIKYSPAGNQLWVSVYTAEIVNVDESYDIAVCPDGNIVVTGYSEDMISVDAATVKYDSATGAQIWAARYNGQGDSTDYAESITTDSSGNIYIHGASFETDSTDYLTVCYNADGVERWKMNYDGPAGLTDIGTAEIVVDHNNIYVTGYSQSAVNNYDYATIKYTAKPGPSEPNACPVPPAGDLTGDCQVNFFDLIVLADGYIGSQEDYLTLKNIADTWLNCGLTEPDDCWQ